jgi:Ca-activated chloride channel family protein
MQFGSKHFLWLLLVLPPALALFFWWSERARQKLLAQFIESRLLASLTVGLSPARRKIRFALAISAVALLIVAIARPQYGYDKEEVQQNGLDIIGIDAESRRGPDGTGGFRGRRFPGMSAYD